MAAAPRIVQYKIKATGDRLYVGSVLRELPANAKFEASVDVNHIGNEISRVLARQISPADGLNMTTRPFKVGDNVLYTIYKGEKNQIQHTGTIKTLGPSNITINNESSEEQYLPFTQQSLVLVVNGDLNEARERLKTIVDNLESTAIAKAASAAVDPLVGNRVSYSFKVSFKDGVGTTITATGTISKRDKDSYTVQHTNGTKTISINQPGLTLDVIGDDTEVPVKDGAAKEKYMKYKARYLELKKYLGL